MLQFTPYQRICIALARGIQVRPSKTMEWIANIHVLTPHPRTSDLSVFPIKSDTPVGAARDAALQAGKMLFGLEPEITLGFTSEREPNLFLVSVGVQENSEDGIVLVGHTLSILIREYQGR